MPPIDSYNIQKFKDRFLVILGGVLFLVHGAALIILLLSPLARLDYTIIALGFTLSLLFSLFLYYRGYYQSAAILLCSVLNIELLFGLVNSNSDSNFLFLFGLAQSVLVAGMLIETRAVFFTATTQIVIVIIINTINGADVSSFFLFTVALVLSAVIFALYQQSLERTLADNTSLLNQVREQAAVLATQNEQLRQLNAEQERFVITLEERVVERTAELQETVGELNAFVSTVAHDLKTPLGGIIGYGEMVLEDLSELPETAESTVIVGGMVRSAFRMRDIIDSLLMLARTRTTEVALAPVDMAHVVAHVQDRLDYLIAHKQVQLVVPAQWPAAMGQAAWVEEVWANYISNAIKYGGHPPVIQLGADVEPDGRAVRFWVQDNGEGLSRADQDRLFLPFVQLSQAKDSHGLGLSIVQRIVTKLGGRVGVESEIGRGSRFYFTLPVVEELVALAT